MLQTLLGWLGYAAQLALVVWLLENDWLDEVFGSIGLLVLLCLLWSRITRD